MNKNEKVYIAVTVAVVAVTAVRYVKFRQEERARRAKIIVDADAQIEAINAAAKTMQKRIRAGEYIDKSLNDVMTDLDFEVIALRYEE